MKPQVVNLRIKKNKNISIPVDRTSVLGNPFYFDHKTGTDEDRKVVKRAYKEWIFYMMEGRDATFSIARKYAIKVASIYKKTTVGEVQEAMHLLCLEWLDNKDLKLGCWCAPLECHADVLADAIVYYSSTLKVLSGSVKQ
jgi:hypothetical protein